MEERRGKGRVDKTGKGPGSFFVHFTCVFRMLNPFFLENKKEGWCWVYKCDGGKSINLNMSVSLFGTPGRVKGRKYALGNA